MAAPKTVKTTILKITVANQKTVFPGDVLELSEGDFRLLSSSDKAKEYEPGDEKKFKVIEKDLKK